MIELITSAIAFIFMIIVVIMVITGSSILGVSLFVVKKENDDKNENILETKTKVNYKAE